jgi:DNA-binding transcriptional ArsR family regulator
VIEDRCDLLCVDFEKAETLRARRLDADTAERASAHARALADPTRLTIACAIAEGGELCVCDIAWVMERAENLVSHHLRLLREGGLVSSRRDGKMMLYELTERGRTVLEAIGLQAVAV